MHDRDEAPTRLERGRLERSPVASALCLLWPWAAPWRIPAARGAHIGADADADGAPLRVVAANALGPNRRAGEWAAAVAALEADVLVVIEASPVVLGALEAAGIAGRYPSSFVERRPKWAGCAVFVGGHARLLDAGDAGYAYLAVEVEVAGGRRCTVMAVHTVAPTSRREAARWVRSFDTLEDVVARLPRPLVAAGDYNATLGHRPLRRFLASTGLLDAHSAVGRGLARTWPGGHWIPSFALLDRMLVSDGVRAARIGEVRLPGSDHRAVIADLVVC